MGTLHLVRHGQASFGAADYDVLSPLGERQCRRLGAYWRARGLAFEAAYSGSLRRQRDSLAAVLAGLEVGLAAEQLPGLDEYDSDAIVRALYPEPPPPADPGDAYRHQFRLLREALHAWMDGRTVPAGMPSRADFVAGVAAALDCVRERHSGDVLMIASGGPIATAVGLLLDLGPRAVIELNLRIRNSAVTELAFNPRGHRLHSFNVVAHLDATPDWVTFT